MKHSFSENEQPSLKASGQRTPFSAAEKDETKVREDQTAASCAVPSWILEEITYTPEPDHDGFLIKSMLKILSVLNSIRSLPVSGRYRSSPLIKLTATLLFITLSALSKNMLFTYVLIAVLLVRLAMLPSKALVRVMKGAVSAALMSALILLPSVFLRSPGTMLLVSLKLFLSAGLILLLSVTTPWNELTGALHAFHIPDLFIMTFDITLKYIVILGDICYNILTALKLRSVGKNRQKGHSLSGVMGVTFEKSKVMADDMYDAMTCRGFNGTYKRPRKTALKREDLPLVFLMACVLAAFLFLEGVL